MASAHSNREVKDQSQHVFTVVTNNCKSALVHIRFNVSLHVSMTTHFSSFVYLFV